MPLYPYHVSHERFSTLPPVAELPTVEADSIEAALVKLAREARLPNEIGVQFWVWVVLGTANGKAQVASVPITPEAKIPLGWDGPAGTEAD